MALIEIDGSPNLNMVIFIDFLVRYVSHNHMVYSIWNATCAVIFSRVSSQLSFCWLQRQIWTDIWHDLNLDLSIVHHPDMENMDMCAHEIKIEW